MGGIQVLHVDDDAQIRDLVATYLGRSDDVTVHGAADADEGIATLDARDDIDCVVSDYDMPGRDGIAFLQTIRERWPELPFILYTGEGSEEIAAAAVDHDVSGYIRKGGAETLKLLENRIRNETASYEVVAGYRSYKAVIDSMQDPVYVLDDEGRITDVNEAFTELTGYDEDTLLGREMSVIKSPEMVARSERHLRSLLSDREPDRPLFEVQIQTADGRTVTCEDHMGVIPFEGEAFRGSVGVLRDVEERTRRERELARERDRFQTLFESLPIAAVHARIADGKPVIEAVNEEFERVFGYDDAVGENLDALLAPANGDRPPSELTERLDAGDRITEIAARKTADGERLFRVDVVLRETEGQLREGYATYLDISDIEAIQSQERALIERMSEGLFAVDGDWRLTTFNERGYRLLREAAPGEPDRETLRGRVLWEVVPGIVGTPFEDRYRTAMASQEPTSFEEYYEPLDRWFDVRAFPSPDGLSIHFRNVTDERERQAAIRSRQETLRRVYEAVADQAPFTEQVERLLAVGAEVLGVEYGTLARVEDGRYTFEVTHGDHGRVGETIPVSETACERVTAADGTVTYGDIREEAPELTDRELVSGRSVRCYAGAPVVVDGDCYGVFCFYSSTDRSRFSEWEVTLVNLMARLVGYTLQTQRSRDALERQNERLEELATVLSHDLRNPLSVARGNLELARDRGDPQFFEKTMTALERIEELTADLLALARDGQTVEETQPVSLAAVARGSWGTVSTESAELVTASDATIAAEERRLKRIFENLYRNALDHAGPTPTVTVGVTDDGFFVADDGPGVPPGERDAIFESGFTTDETGHGLGLSIVEQLAEAHGWTVRVTDSESGGARFEFAGVRFVDSE